MKKKSLRLLVSLSIMTGLLAVSFSFDRNGIHWMWEDQQPVAWVLGCASVVLSIAWFMQRRMQALASGSQN